MMKVYITQLLDWVDWILSDGKNKPFLFFFQKIRHLVLVEIVIPIMLYKFIFYENTHYIKHLYHFTIDKLPKWQNFQGLVALITLNNTKWTSSMYTREQLPTSL